MSVRGPALLQSPMVKLPERTLMYSSLPHADTLIQYSVSSLASMTDRLESIARQNMLGSHLSPSGTECYITSDMFYVEVQLEAAGQLVDVKVAHHGENPASCPELIQHLSEKNFEEFSKHLKGLVNLYKIPGDNKLKTKMYLALQSLELDLTKMMHMF
ncbi:hypothetical protein NHX12_016713, partial [Muraenolepis orangiensis]